MGGRSLVHYVGKTLVFTVLYCSVPVAKSYAVASEVALAVKTMGYRAGEQTYLDWKELAAK